MIKTRLLRLLKKDKKYIFLNVLFQWISLLMQIILIINLTEALLWVFNGYNPPENFIVIVLITLVTRFVMDKLAVWASFKASMNVKRVLREAIYDKLVRLGASYKECISTSEVVQLSTEGVEQLEIYFGRYLPQFMYSLIAPITLFIALKNICFEASLALLLCVPLIPLSIVLVQKFAKKLLSKYWGIYTGLGDSFLENLQGLTTLKVYSADGIKAKEMDEEAQLFRRITMKVLTMQLNSTSLMDIMAYGGASCGMIVAMYQFINYNTLSAGGVLAIVLLAAEFFLPLRILGSYFHIAMNGMSASDKIFKILDLKEPDEKPNEVDVTNLDINFSKVYFSYDDNDVLSDINLDINTGLISIVGESGSGKSTIASLIMGKNKGYKGSIKIGNVELSTIKESSIMEHITLVKNNSFIFKGSVYDNLAMGNESSSEEVMINALKIVNLYDEIKDRGGLDMQLDEMGQNLSGGQKQRLAMARALLHNTPIYIFDEATSNIDAESEEMIMNVIKRLAKNRLVILISHRLYNVKDSKMIYMLKEHKIVESGNHDKLMKLNGSYAHLYNTQIQLENYAKEGRHE